MKHNNFNFTIKVTLPKNRDKFFIKEYLAQCCDEMYQQSAFLKETLTSCIRPNVYISFVTLTVKDYGVPEVGVDLIASWIEQLYKYCKGFVIDTVIVHPKSNPPAKGAIIKWDYINDCAIIKVIKAK